MISRDHEGADTRSACARHGLPRLRARRIDHPYQAEKNQVLFDVLVDILAAE